jgi:hypothetical protein
MYRFLQKHLGLGQRQSPAATPTQSGGESAAVAPRNAPRSPPRPVAELMASPAMSGNEYVAEGDVDRAFIGEAFSRCFFGVRFDADGDVWVNDMDGPRVLVGVEPDRRSILLLAFYRFKQGVPQEARLELVSRCNSEVRMVRFRLSGDETLVADYSLSYERGLLVAQLIQSVRLFSRITVAALRQCDPDDILQ